MATHTLARLLPSDHALREVEGYSRDQLIGIAVARGCRHYASFADSWNKVNVPTIPHEVLGCALLRGAPDVDTFQSIRVASMVISDAGNSPDMIGAAAAALGVESRVTHIAKLALKADNQPDFWEAVLASVPTEDNASEAGFLPSITRFRCESPITGLGRGPSRAWLRTAYVR